jgi:hypothetical protein
MSLNDGELNTLNEVLSGAVQYASGAARLYKAHPQPNNWTFTGHIGAAVVLEDKNFSYIRLVDLKTREITLDQEFYDNFHYQKANSHFHTFEMNDFVAGLLFADAEEAETFYAQVVSGIEALKPAAPAPVAAPAPTPVHAPPPVHTPAPVSAPVARPPPAQAPPPRTEQPAAPPPSTPTPTPAPAAKEDSGTPALPMKVIPIKNPLINREETKAAPKKSGFSLFGKKEKPKSVIGAPTNVKHEGHIGWDPEHGFDIKNIPPEWKKLFQNAGIKKNDLKDVEFAKTVVTTVAEALTAPPPPPPPPPSGKAPPPPPSGKAPPRSTPAGGGGGGGSSVSLLDQIKSGKELKKVEPPSALPNIQQMDESTNGNLVATLQAAMAARRTAVEHESDSDAQDSADEWSD